MFIECGWPAWVVLFASLLAVGVGLVAISLAIWKPQVGLAVSGVAFALALAPPAVGAVGTMLARRTVDDVLNSGVVDPSQAARIREVGYAEAATCTTLGVSFGGLPVLLAIAGLSVGYFRRRRQSATASSDSQPQ